MPVDSEPRRRVPTWWIIVGVAVLVVAGAITGGVVWRNHVADSAAAQVRVAWEFRSPRCPESQVTGPLNGQRTIDLTATTRCTVAVDVTNGSGRTVHLGDLALPLSGPASRADFRVIAVDGHHPTVVDPQFSADASYDLDQDLPAGQRVTHVLTVVTNPVACDIPGGFQGLHHWPQVEFSTLGRRYTSASPVDLRVRPIVRLTGCHDS